MKKILAVFGLLALVALTAQAQFSGSPGGAVLSSSGGIYGTNANGLYPTSIAGNTALTNYVLVSSPGSTYATVQVDGKTVSGTSSTVIGLYGAAKPAVLSLSAGAYTPSASTPVQFLGYVTNANTTSASCTLANLAPVTSSISMAPYVYVGFVWNIDAEVLTNYNVTLVH